MLTRYVSCFYCVLSGCTVWAQRLDSVSSCRLIGLQPLQVVVREAVLSYEWPINGRMSIDVAVGYRYRNPSAGPEASIGKGTVASYELYQMLNPYHQAIKLAASPLVYLNARRSIYVQGEYFFRHWWLDNTHIIVNTVENSTTDFDAVRTERINVYGTKALIGARGYLSRRATATGVMYSVYAGIGFRIKTYWYESRDGTFEGQPIDYQYEKGILYLPSVHLGLLLNVGIGK